MSHEQILASRPLLTKEGEEIDYYENLQYLALKSPFPFGLGGGPDITYSPILVETKGSHIVATIVVTGHAEYAGYGVYNATVTLIQETTWEKIAGEWIATRLTIYEKLEGETRST